MPLSEPLGVLALAADLATGRPKGSGLTGTLLSTALARALGFSIEDQKAVYLTAAARFLGCTITSHETGMMGMGDDQGFAVATMLADWDDEVDMRRYLDRFVATDMPSTDRKAAFDAIIETLGVAAFDFTKAHCRQAFLISKRLALPQIVCDSIPYYYARWDGKILPYKGRDIPAVSRAVRVSEMAELVRRIDGRQAAIETIRAKSSAELDPEICAVFLDQADSMFDALEGIDEFAAFVADEPGDPIPVTAKCEELMSECAADMADHKSVHFAGHSRRVAALAAAAGRALNRSDQDVRRLRMAGLVHDIGKTAVSNRIWYKTGELSISERLEMESHSYQTEFILSHAKPFSSYAQLASSVQERADGTGYHKRVALADVDANVLAAANEYDELTHGTTGRVPVGSDQAAERLNAMARDRKFLPTAVGAVLHAAGHSAKSVRTSYPFNLTRRQTQVLARLAKSETTAQIAAALGISEKTADHHIQAIYDKTGTRGRPAIALLAMEHGIVVD